MDTQRLVFHASGSPRLSERAFHTIDRPTFTLYTPESPMSMFDLLTQLSQISSNLYRRTSPPSNDSCLGFDMSAFLLPCPELALDIPTPTSLTDILVEAGASLPFAQELSAIHARRSAELAEQYEQNYRKSCIEIANGMGNSSDINCMELYLPLQQGDQRLYYRTVHAWEQDVIGSVQRHFRARKSGTSQYSAGRPTFNTVWGHILLEFNFTNSAYDRILH